MIRLAFYNLFWFLNENPYSIDQNKRPISWGEKSVFVDSEFVKTCDELVIDLSWDDPWFWKKLRYALPHKGANTRCCKCFNVRKKNVHQMHQTTHTIQAWFETYLRLKSGQNVEIRALNCSKRSNSEMEPYLFEQVQCKGIDKFPSMNQ